MTTTVTNGELGLDSFVAHCQRLAGDLIDGPRPNLARALRQLACDVRADLPMPQRLLIRYLFSRTVARTVGVIGAEHRADILSALLEWESMDAIGDHWQLGLKRLADLCAAAVVHSVSPYSRRPGDPLVDRALSVIAARYAEPTLSSSLVARALEVSRFHLARVMTAHTGASVAAHIRKHRIERARQLLTTTAMRVKEIAAAIGYDDSTRFGRQFRRLLGTTPAAYRRRHLAGQS